MSIAGALRSWWSDRRAENEYHALPDAERSAISRDLRVPEDVLERIVEHGGTPLELPRMLEALDLDPAAVKRAHPGVMRDLEVTCAGCGEQAHCHRDLDSGTAPDLYDAYCPNAVTIDALLQENAAGARRQS
jgi:hypothetical protein